MKHSSTPAYSFGTKTVAEPKTTNKLTPGPGTYSLRKDEDEVTAPVIGTGLRPELYPKNMYPGPGSYSVPNFLDAKKLSKGEKKREKTDKPTSGRDKTDKTKLDAPGPGSYNPQKLTKSCSYSMGNKIFGILNDQPKEIGPGQYQPNYDSVEVNYRTKFGIGNRPDMFGSKGFPGPGAYAETDKKEGPRYTFGTEARERKFLSTETPAPWAYDIPGLTEDLKNKPGKTLAPKRPLVVKDSGAPGPGAYQPRLSETTPSFSVGTGSRSSFINVKKSPGPGEYEPKVPAHVSRTSNFGTGARPPLTVPKFTPGPGAYGLDSTLSGPKYGMSGRRIDLKTSDQVPGPGQYEPTISYAISDSKSHVIGTGQRSNLGRTRANNFPGPGSYYNDKKAKTQTWSFGKDPKHKEIFEDEPGPGQYEIPPSVPDVPKYLLAASSSIKI